MGTRSAPHGRRFWIVVILILVLPTPLLAGNFGPGPEVLTAALWIVALVICVASVFYFRKR